LESLHVWTNIVQGSTKYVDSGMCLTLQNHSTNVSYDPLFNNGNKCNFILSLKQIVHCPSHLDISFFLGLKFDSIVLRVYAILNIMKSTNQPTNQPTNTEPWWISFFLIELPL